MNFGMHTGGGIAIERLANIEHTHAGRVLLELDHDREIMILRIAFVLPQVHRGRIDAGEVLRPQFSKMNSK